MVSGSFSSSTHGTPKCLRHWGVGTLVAQQGGTEVETSPLGHSDRPLVKPRYVWVSNVDLMFLGPKIKLECWNQVDLKVFVPYYIIFFSTLKNEDPISKRFFCCCFSQADFTTPLMSPFFFSTREMESLDPGNGVEWMFFFLACSWWLGDMICGSPGKPEVKLIKLISAMLRNKTETSWGL